MDDDDFLWHAALINHIEKDRQWIIPDITDLQVPEQSNGVEPINEATVLQSFSLHAFAECSDAVDSLKVLVLEERGSGVFDVIGGEVWEASLLLTSWLLLNDHIVESNDSILELGSGVALPSLALYKLSSYRKQSLIRNITCSDYDLGLLSNLITNISQNLCQYSHNNLPHNIDTFTMDLNIAFLDWTLFHPSLSFTNLDVLLPTLLQRNHPSLLYGSALCYTKQHSTYLAHLIHYYLSGNTCREVIILQIEDREGFRELVAILQQQGSSSSSSPAGDDNAYFTMTAEARSVIQYTCSMEMIEEEVYAHAQLISCQKRLQSSREYAVPTYLEYRIPLPGRASSVSDNITAAQDGTAQSDHDESNMDNRKIVNKIHLLLQTDREAFRLLRIKKI